MADQQTLLLVDTYSLIYQVYHAIRQPMTGRSGQPTNAVYGFTRDLTNLIKKKQPTHFVCAIDAPTADRESARHEMYADYKANRDPMPENLVPQIPLVMQVVEAHNIPVVSSGNWEADDVIATLARAAEAEGFDVVIVSSDKDLRQLISDKVTLYNIRKDQVIDAEFLAEDWGIRPDQVIDFQSLVGDSVDNVPGVPLVGPKKASALLAEFGTLEEVLANPDKAKGKKLQSNLKEFAEQALLSRELVTLKTDLDLPFTLEDAILEEPDYDALLDLYNELNFRTFASELMEQGKGLAGHSADRSWSIVQTQEEFDAFLKELRQQSAVCIDLETSSIDAVRAQIVGWAVCWSEGEAYYLPVNSDAAPDALDADVLLAGLKLTLEDESVTKINQNIKYDLLVWKRHDIAVRGIGMDPMVGHYLLDAGARSHSLDTLAERYLNRRMIPITSLIGKGKTQKTMFEVDLDKAAEYASEDADVTLRLASLIEAELKEEGLYDLYWTLERPLIDVLATMELAGIRIDVAELERQSAAVTQDMEALEAEIYSEAGREFNIDSPKQLQVVLFEELGLPVIKKTKTGASTDQEVLETLATEHQATLPRLIMAHRSLSKLRGTYLDALPKMVNPTTGRVHCSFNQVVTATGRLSSSDPNLQNIPVRTEQGRQVRKAFVPESDSWRLVCADYSQIELRMLAHFSHDEELLAAFRDGVDIHSSVAAQIYGVQLDEVTREMRAVAKGVNFGVIYGQSAFGLATVLGIDQPTAAEFIKAYFAQYPSVTNYMNDVLKTCRRNGYAETIRGRRRALSGIRSRPTAQRTTPERLAINTVIQGSAADLIKEAMLRVVVRLEQENHSGRMLLQIHDELVFECPEADVPSLAKLAREEMATAMELDVPLVVDVSAGKNWLEKSLVEG